MKSVGTAIVGGGIVGVSLAYYLALHGESDIVVFEGRDLGSGCTAGSFGGVRQQFSTPEMVEFALRGRRFWETFEEAFEYPCTYHRDGYLLVTGNPERYEALVAAADVQRAAGAPGVEIVAGPDIPSLIPWISSEDLIAGSWTPDDGRVNPTDGLSGIAAAARRLGVTFRTGVAVDSLNRVAGGWRLDAAEPTVARRVAVAAGLGTPGLVRPFGLDLPITPMKVHTGFTTRMLDDQPLPVTIDLDTGLVVEREQDGACFTIVSGRSPSDYSVMDMLEEFGEAASTRAPVFTDAEIRTTMTAYADATGGDGQPFAGSVDDDLWVLSGFDAHGTMMGPCFAEFTAMQMSGAQDGKVDAAIFDPWRTPSGHEWMRSGSH
jgi:sarcosine oxidase subunit beta